MAAAAAAANAWRLVRREQLWNGNRETLRGAFWGRDSLFGHALRTCVQRRRDWPLRFRGLPITRLRSNRAVDEWLAATAAAPGYNPRRHA